MVASPPMAAIKGVILYDSYGRPMVLAGGIASETTLLAILREMRMVTPSALDSNNQAVTTGAAVSFPVIVGNRYVISCSTEMTFLGGAAPTATTGGIIPAGGMIGPIEAEQATIQLIATTANGRASVIDVTPAP